MTRRLLMFAAVTVLAAHPYQAPGASRRPAAHGPQTAWRVSASAEGGQPQPEGWNSLGRPEDFLVLSAVQG